MAIATPLAPTAGKSCKLLGRYVCLVLEGIIRPRDFLVFSLLLAACGDDDATGLAPPANLTGELAYVSGGAIVIRNLADGGTRRIDLNTEALGSVNGLTWQPDGRALVYAPLNFERYFYELHRVPLDGSPVSVLYPKDARQAYPAFAPDGRLGYWVNGLEHGSEIFVDGAPFYSCGGPGHGTCMQSRPAWSPDGSAMVVAGRSSGLDRLIQVTLATGAETIVFQAAGDQSVEQLLNPVYSRSGDRVAFTRLVFGPNRQTDEIWVMNADGSNQQRLTSGHHDDLAMWSPDDAWIAFSRTEAPGVIGLVSATGGPVARLAEGALVAAWR